MDHATLLALAAELRARAAGAPEAERTDLLFLAAEYQAAAAGGTIPDQGGDFSVIIPK